VNHTSGFFFLCVCVGVRGLGFVAGIADDDDDHGNENHSYASEKA
jgi:hypothetical protein